MDLLSVKYKRKQAKAHHLLELKVFTPNAIKLRTPQRPSKIARVPTWRSLFPDRTRCPAFAWRRLFLRLRDPSWRRCRSSIRHRAFSSACTHRASRRHRILGRNGKTSHRRLTGLGPVFFVFDDFLGSSYYITTFCKTCSVLYQCFRIDCVNLIESINKYHRFLAVFSSGVELAQFPH